jgi:hypothetical protein
VAIPDILRLCPGNGLLSRNSTTNVWKWNESHGSTCLSDAQVRSPEGEPLRGNKKVGRNSLVSLGRTWAIPLTAQIPLPSSQIPPTGPPGQGLFFLKHLEGMHHEHTNCLCRRASHARQTLGLEPVGRPKGVIFSGTFGSATWSLVTLANGTTTTSLRLA